MTDGEKEIESKEVSTPAPDGDDDNAMVQDMIKQANDSADKLEAADVAMNKTLDRQERIMARQALGGRSEAGSLSQTDEEKADAEARKLLAGTGFEEQVFPTEKKP